MKIVEQHQCVDRYVAIFQEGDIYYQFWSEDGVYYSVTREKRMSDPGLVMCTCHREATYRYIARLGMDTTWMNGDWEEIIKDPSPWIVRHSLA
jgi:hypothetical protein